MLNHLRQLGKESLIYGVSGVVSRFLSVLLVPIYARVFSTEEYGYIGLITTTMGLLQIFVVLALDNSAARWFYETDEIRDRKSTIASWLWCQLSVATVVGLVMIMASEWLGIFILGDPSTGVYFRISGATLPLLTLSTGVINWFRYQRRPTATIIFTITISTTTVLLTILFVVGLKWSLEGIYLAQLISASIGTIAAVLIMKDWINPTYFRWLRLGEMLRYAIPLIPASIAFWIVNLSSRYFIQAYSTTSEVGVYQLGATIAMVMALVTTAFQQAWGPYGLSIYKQPEARNVYASVFLVYIWLTVSLSTALALFAPEIIRIFATKDYLGASPIVGILAFGYVFIGLNYIANTGPAIVKDMRPLGVAMVGSAVVNIGLNFLLVPKLGKSGSAIATLISLAIVSIYVFYRSQQLYPIPYRFKSAIGIFIFAIIIIFGSTIINISNIWGSIFTKLLLLLLFIPISLLLRVVTPDQLRIGWNKLFGG